MSVYPPKSLQVTAALAAICVAIVLAPVPSAARLPAGLLLALVLPGYGLVCLLFPGRSLERAELVACVLGLSLVAAALSGLLLNLAPGHFGRSTWTIFLASLTLACCTGAGLRKPAPPRGGLTGPADEPAGVRGALRRLRSPRNVTALLLSLAAVTITSVAMAIAVQASSAQKPPLTLWLKPLADRRVQVGVSPGASIQAGLVLVVHEKRAKSYVPLPVLTSAHTYTKTLTVPVGTAEIVVDLEQGPRTLRHVQYWYSTTRSR
jgi:hypothetical protein